MKLKGRVQFRTFFESFIHDVLSEKRYDISPQNIFIWVWFGESAFDLPPFFCPFRPTLLSFAVAMGHRAKVLWAFNIHCSQTGFLARRHRLFDFLLFRIPRPNLPNLKLEGFSHFLPIIESKEGTEAGRRCTTVSCESWEGQIQKNPTGMVHARFIKMSLKLSSCSTTPWQSIDPQTLKLPYTPFCYEISLVSVIDSVRFRFASLQWPWRTKFSFNQWAACPWIPRVLVQDCHKYGTRLGWRRICWVCFFGYSWRRREGDQYWFD